MALRQKYSPIGVDIGPDSLKLVQFRRRGTARRGSAMSLCAAVRLPVALPTNGDGDGTALVRDLKKALLRKQFGSRRAVLTLPPSQVAVRPLLISTGAKDKDVNKSVRWEMESFLSYNIDDAIIDHVVLGESKSAGERRLEVLAAAVEKAKVLRVLDLLSKAGLAPERIEIASLALCRYLARRTGNPQGASAVIDVGARCTEAAIMDNRELRMSRTIDLGGDAFTDAISKALEVNRDEAEVLKCQHGAGLPESGPGAMVEAEPTPQSEDWLKIAKIIHDILRDKLESLAAELTKLVRYFSSQNQGRTVEKVTLVGGSARLKHLDTLLAARLSTPVEVGDPIRELADAEADLKDTNEAAFAVAAGLALRDD